MTFHFWSPDRSGLAPEINMENEQENTKQKHFRKKMLTQTHTRCEEGGKYKLKRVSERNYYFGLLLFEVKIDLDHKTNAYEPLSAVDSSTRVSCNMFTYCIAPVELPCLSTANAMSNLWGWSPCTNYRRGWLPTLGASPARLGLTADATLWILAGDLQKV